MMLSCRVCLGVFVCMVAGRAGGMVILCDEGGLRLVTTENQRRMNMTYQHAVAAAVVAERRPQFETGDLIGQPGDGRRQLAAAAAEAPFSPTSAVPGAPSSAPPPSVRPPRPMVQRDKAAQAVRLCNRGLLQMQSGKFNEATEAFDQAMKLNPGDGRAVMLRGVIEARQGQHSKALPFYNRALELDPGLVEAYQSRGLSLMKLEQLPEAISDFTKAVALNPKFEEGFVRRGLAYGRIGEYAKSVADNTAAIALNPKNPLSYNNRAAAYTAMGDKAKAAADLEMSKKLEAEAKSKAKKK